MNNEKSAADYCGTPGDYLDGCDEKYPRYDYKGDYVAMKLEGFAKRVFLPSKI